MQPNSEEYDALSVTLLSTLTPEQKMAVLAGSSGPLVPVSPTLSMVEQQRLQIQQLVQQQERFRFESELNKKLAEQQRDIELEAELDRLSSPNLFPTAPFLALDQSQQQSQQPLPQQQQQPEFDMSLFGDQSFQGDLLQQQLDAQYAMPEDFLMEPLEMELTITPEQILLIQQQQQQFLQQQQLQQQLLQQPQQSLSTSQQREEQKLWKKMFGGSNTSHSNNRISTSPNIIPSSKASEKQPLSGLSSSSTNTKSWFSRNQSKSAPTSRIQDSDSESSDSDSESQSDLGKVLSGKNGGGGPSNAKFGGQFGGVSSASSASSLFRNASATNLVGRRSTDKIAKPDVVMSDADDEAASHYLSDAASDTSNSNNNPKASVSSLKAKLSSLALNMAPKAIVSKILHSTPSPPAALHPVQFPTTGFISASTASSTFHAQQPPRTNSSTSIASSHKSATTTSTGHLHVPPSPIPGTTIPHLMMNQQSIESLLQSCGYVSSNADSESGFSSDGESSLYGGSQTSSVGRLSDAESRSSKVGSPRTSISGGIEKHHGAAGSGSGVKPFMCAECGRSFLRKHDFKRHVVSTHYSGEVQQIQCDVCHQTFKRLDGLRRHQKGRCKGPVHAAKME